MPLPSWLPDEPLELFRYFLKDDIRDRVDFSRSDQRRGLPMPPLEQPAAPDAPRVALPDPAEFEALGVGAMPLIEAIRRRESVRDYGDAPLSSTGLSFLLWATQGIRARRGPFAVRNVPSAGNRHALETYLHCRLVEGIATGLYRYLPTEHALVRLKEDADLEAQIIEGCRGQVFAGTCAATFIWTAVPYRMEWRYGLAAHKVIALDAGHVCQNLYLAALAIGAGTCAIAAYDQAGMDRVVGVDGQDEFVVYVAPVGVP